MTPEEIAAVIEAHGRWLRNEPGGTRADLSRANLYGADLYGANLYGADLYGANLSHANLYGADLYGANLSRANLGGANLGGADLSRANLSHANLYDAYLPVGMHVLQIGPIGSRRATLMWLHDAERDIVMTGCFSGSLEEFERAVEKTHGDSEHGRAYAAAIALIRLVRNDDA